MRIGVDIDDVIVETLPAYIRAFEARFGRRVALAHAHWDPFAFHPDIPAADRLAFFEELRGSRFMFTRPVHPEAPPAVRALQEAGHTLIVVSGRPQTHLAETEAMLERIGIRACFAEIVHRDGQTIPDYKRQAARERRLDLLVEDEFPAARAVAETGVPVLLMDRPWNQGDLPARVLRVASWPEVLARVASWPPRDPSPPTEGPG